MRNQFLPRQKPLLSSKEEFTPIFIKGILKLRHSLIKIFTFIGLIYKKPIIFLLQKRKFSLLYCSNQNIFLQIPEPDIQSLTNIHSNITANPSPLIKLLIKFKLRKGKKRKLILLQGFQKI